MKGKEINLSQMLLRREKRAEEQKKFLEIYNSPLISFSMNIPGPIKTNELIRRAFDTGKKLILEALENINAEINNQIEIHEDTGHEILLSVKKSDPEKLKDIFIKIETKADKREIDYLLERIKSESIDKSKFEIPDYMEKVGKYNFLIPKELLKKQFIEDCIDVDGMQENL